MVQAYIQIKLKSKRGFKTAYLKSNSVTEAFPDLNVYNIQ